MMHEETIETLFYKQEWEQELDVLLHHLFRKNFLVGIKGEKYVGKTTFVNYLAPHLIHEQQVFYLTISGKEAIGDFLYKLLSGFGIEKIIPEQLSIPEQLRAFLILLHNQEQSFVVIIDNAELASNEILSAIVALLKAQGEKNVFLRFILVGLNAVEERLKLVLEHYQKQVQFYCTSLMPLSRPEVIKFLKFAFSDRISDQLLLQKKFIDMVFEKTRGVPGRIAALMKTSWLDDYQKKQNHRKSPQFLTVIRTFGAMIVALVVLNISYFISRYAEIPKLQLHWIQDDTSRAIAVAEQRFLKAVNYLILEGVEVAPLDVKMLQQQRFFINPFLISSKNTIEKHKLKVYPVSTSLMLIERFPGVTAVFSSQFQHLIMTETNERFIAPPTVLAKPVPEIISIQWVNGAQENKK